MKTGTLFLIFCLAAAAHADFSGRIEFEGQSFLESLDKKTDEKYGEIKFMPTVTAKRGSVSFKFTAEGEASTSQRHFKGFVQDLFVRKKNGANTWTLGFNTYSWGVTDGYNPLDVVNPRDFSDPLHAKKMGSFGLHYSRALTSSLQIETLYIPVQTTSILPAEKSRWLPRRIFLPAGEDMQILLPDHVDYSIRHAEDLNALQNNFGARLLLTEGDREWGLVFFDGMSNMPVIRADIVTGPPLSLFPIIVLAVDPNVVVTPVYYRVQTTGASLVWSFDSFIMRLQSAYTHVRSKADENDLPSWSQENVWAFEKNMAFGAVSVTALLQGTYNQRSRAAGSSSGLTELLDRAVMLGFRVSPSLAWESYVFAGVDTQGQGSLMGFSLGHNLTEQTKLEIRGDFLQGPDSSWVGSYRNNDQIYFSFSYLM